MPGNGFIEIRAVKKSYGTQQVLMGVDLMVREGETMVVMGGSGSGKSVLLRHIIGLEKPDSGQVFVEGEDITEFTEKELLPIRKKVGMLFQGSALFDSLTVFENVAFPLREHTRWSEERVRNRIHDVLGLVGLDEAEEKLPAELSGGMKKRAALARSIAMEPRGLLYDEPTTGLDPLTTTTILELIQDLQKRLHVTSVVVTHSVEAAFTVGDRVAFLRDGRIRFVGSADEAARSEDPELRAFLDASAGT